MSWISFPLRYQNPSSQNPLPTKCLSSPHLKWHIPSNWTSPIKLSGISASVFNSFTTPTSVTLRPSIWMSSLSYHCVCVPGEGPIKKFTCTANWCLLICAKSNMKLLSPRQLGLICRKYLPDSRRWHPELQLKWSWNYGNQNRELASGLRVDFLY